MTAEGGLTISKAAHKLILANWDTSSRMVVRALSGQTGQLLTVFLLLGTAGPPLAQAAPLPSGPLQTGNQLYEICRADRADCLGYIAGVADTAGLMSSRWNICLPAGTSVRQMTLAFQNYVSQNPATLTEPAADLVLRGLQQNFPCKPGST